MTKIAFRVALVAALLVYPFVVTENWAAVGVAAGIAGIAAIGLNVLTGVARQFSVGHAAFIALGAYVTGYFMYGHGWSFFAAAPFGVGAAAGLGLLVAPLAVRLRHLALALVTLGLVFLVQHLIRNIEALGGSGAARIIPDVELFGSFVQTREVAGLELTRSTQYYLLVLVVLALVAVFTANLLRSRTGRAMASIGEHASELVASHSGVRLTTTTIKAFVFSSALAGLAGTLIAPYRQVLDLDSFGLGLSVEYLAIIVIGGLGSVAGALYGAAFVYVLPQLVRAAAPSLPFVAGDGELAGGISIPNLTTLLYSLLVVFLLVFEPGGIAALIDRSSRRLRRGPKLDGDWSSQLETGVPG